MLLTLALTAALSNPAACENLESLSLPDTTITSPKGTREHKRRAERCV